ncbi:unnamed protein product [Rotaria magnacalcarata]|uniref:Ubiquitin carboxyl-terminal hydrolase n=1 Tax=Rotaria magnacalcarata TaxID=392030 RepID=A0A816C284_9BILA|nr:unnamed protein product [Rotaria magnacalcarata]CAF3856235.1 unnamed protein product [Rotaria magnacalcarata]
MAYPASNLYPSLIYPSSSLYDKDYAQSRQMINIVPKLYTTPKVVTFRVCRSYRDQYDHIYIYISEDKTLIQLKEEISRQLKLLMKHTDFSLTKFHANDYSWVIIDDFDGHKTIADLKLCPYTMLNVETPKETNNNIQNNVSNIRDPILTLKLCKQPMNKLNWEYISIHSSNTIRQLKEEARKRVKNQKTKHLYLWTSNAWMKLRSDWDHLTVAESDVNEFSMISFEIDDDPIPGLCGLTNLGNTCFMNSALQCLSNIPEFTREIRSLGNEINAPIIGAYAALIRSMWSGEHTITTPSSLLLNISESLPRFRQYQQQDAQEFMNHFLHLIHQELTNERTLITDQFYGRIQSSVKCLGGCNSIETREEVISFLPLPVENDINQYEILYLESNGDQSLVSVCSCARTIGTLIHSFIEQHRPQLSSTRIKPVRIAENKIKDEYSDYTRLNDTTRHELAFIEVPEKTFDKSYIEVMFLNSQTYEPFRAPIYIIYPTYDCHESDLSDQMNCIQKHILSKTDAPSSACHLYWIDRMDQRQYLNVNATQKNNQLLFMKQINFELDSKWTEKYTNRYKMDRSSSKPSLKSLLADFFHEEPLNGDYYCSQCCDLKTAKEKADLVLPLPRVLIIQLKRFTYDPYSNTKIDTYIDFPLRDLDLSHYIIEKHGQKMNSSIYYDLVAVSNHTGSLISGHYTTYARNVKNGRWYSFNDERVREIVDENDIVTKNAYILVYVQKATL